MIRRWFILATLLAVVVSSLDAQVSRLRLRQATAQEGGGGEVGGNVITGDDLTYLGSYGVPDPSGGVAINAYGLALRYEESDGVSPVHLLTATKDDSSLARGGWVFEWRDATPQIPATPTDAGQYTNATLVKDWGNIYGAYGSGYKRQYYYQANLTTQDWIGGDDTRHSLFWDDVDDRLYWVYGETYADDSSGNVSQQFHFGYSTLNYGAGTATPNGPWRISGQKFKSGLGGFVRIPSSFVTATGLGTKTIAIGFGGYGSVVASGDQSFGPSLTALTPPSGAEQTALAGTPLIGYWPYASSPSPGNRDRLIRPAWAPLVVSGLNPYDSWDATRTVWNDMTHTYGVWIHGPNKSGFLFASSMAAGMSTYLHATFGWEKQVDFWGVVSEEDLAEVVAGTKAKWEIQPTLYQMDLSPAIDYTDTDTSYTNPSRATIATITSTAGVSQQFDSATVTTTSAHGMQVGWGISIRGTTQESDYAYMWKVGQVLNTTQFTIYNPSNASLLWSGVTATGGDVRYAGQLYLGEAGNGTIQVRGLAYDDNTNKLYMLYSHPNYPIALPINQRTGALMVAVFSVDN
jgi:hypothetical protein